MEFKPSTRADITKTASNLRSIAVLTHVIVWRNRCQILLDAAHRICTVCDSEKRLKVTRNAGPHLSAERVVSLWSALSGTNSIRL
jgi:hypothetical protein